jgi:hypothetical protein
VAGSQRTITLDSTFVDLVTRPEALSDITDDQSTTWSFSTSERAHGRSSQTESPHERPLRTTVRDHVLADRLQANDMSSLGAYVRPRQLAINGIM